ncbi:hypothetical protein GCM10010104_30100 [Streptomyces indiaensis]|uniref:Uncharacterized protein n=1 Tax=Streptomyces indiaensis TaxID=284033 RepID=A0ABN3DJU1_9ACTN
MACPSIAPAWTEIQVAAPAMETAFPRRFADTRPTVTRLPTRVTDVRMPDASDPARRARIGTAPDRPPP